MALLGPQKGLILAQKALFGPPEVRGEPGGPDLVPTTADWSNTIGHMASTHFGLVSALFWTPGAPKGPVLAPNVPFGDPEVPGGPPRTKFGPNCHRLLR